MKKTIILSLCAVATAAISAAELPEPRVQVLPANYGWFDGFAVTWAENITEPYTLTLENTKGITVVKNNKENLDIASVQLVEYQETEESPNYPDSRLVVTLQMLEFEVGASYTLNVPAGSVSVRLSNTESVPNKDLVYSFELRADQSRPDLPDPVCEPAEGTVAKLSSIKMTWKGVLGGYDLLNAINNLLDNDETANEGDYVSPVTMTFNGEEVTHPEISFEWSSRLAKTDGAAGDILVLTLTTEETLPDGIYTILIPGGYLQISDIEEGTYYNDAIILTYIVDETYSGVLSINRANDPTAVYNLNGVKVSDNGVDNLPAGIYIVNGKKVIK